MKTPFTADICQKVEYNIYSKQSSDILYIIDSMRFQLGTFLSERKTFWNGRFACMAVAIEREITRFAVKRLNVPLLATVTVMPTPVPAPLSTLHSHMTR